MEVYGTADIKPEDTIAVRPVNSNEYYRFSNTDLKKDDS